MSGISRVVTFAYFALQLVGFPSLRAQTPSKLSAHLINSYTTGASNIDNIDVRYSTDDGATFPITNQVFFTTDGSVTGFDWTVPNVPEPAPLNTTCSLLFAADAAGPVAKTPVTSADAASSNDHLRSMAPPPWALCWYYEDSIFTGRLSTRLAEGRRRRRQPRELTRLTPRRGYAARSIGRESERDGVPFIRRAPIARTAHTMAAMTTTAMMATTIQ